MKEYVFLLLISVISLKDNYVQAFGLGDETYITPYGNEIDNWLGNDLHTGRKHHFSGLDEWYYYKGFIVGTCRCFPPLGENEREKLGNYVVFNETSHETHFFEEKSEWNAFLNGNGLKPKIWTRWHDGEDNSILYILSVWLFMFSFVLIPVFILCLVFIFKNRQRIKAYHVMIIVSPLLLIFFIWVLEQFPSSI